MEVSSVSRNPTCPLPRTPDTEEVIAALPRPDYSQMIPFKPKVNPLPGEHPVPGKYFKIYLILLYLNDIEPDNAINEILFILKVDHFRYPLLLRNYVQCYHHQDVSEVLLL